MTTRLPANLASDLDWSSHKGDNQTLWELDFDFQFTEASLKSYILAVEQFSELWKKYSGIGVVLYRGSLDILKRVSAENEIEAATIFGDFLHRLASFLPDDVKPYCLFEGSHSFSPARAAQLMSKERFQHLILGENCSCVGLLLPLDENCTPTVLQKIEPLLLSNPRIIPEKMLNEMWDGLDELFVIEEAVSLLGHRHLKGFEAAGGVTRKA